MSDLQERFKSKRIQWSHEELVLTLGYYFFIYGYNTRKKDYESFASDLRSMTGNDRSNGSVGVRFGNYISVDPRKQSSGFTGGISVCKEIWDECIDNNLKPKSEFVTKFMGFIKEYGKQNLKIYEKFLSEYNSYLKKAIDIDDENDVINSENIIEDDNIIPNYEPEEKPVLIDEINKKYKRNPYKAKRSILISKFVCNVDPAHKTFMVKGHKPYMEAHHLIPMAVQDEFNVSLDVDANIVCLCPTCHRKLHYGVDIKDDLRKLYDNRKEMLQQSGINISFEELLEYYK